MLSHLLWALLRRGFTTMSAFWQPGSAENDLSKLRVGLRPGLKGYVAGSHGHFPPPTDLRDVFADSNAACTQIAFALLRLR